MRLLTEPYLNQSSRHIPVLTHYTPLLHTFKLFVAHTKILHFLWDTPSKTFIFTSYFATILLTFDYYYYCKLNNTTNSTNKGNSKLSNMKKTTFALLFGLLSYNTIIWLILCLFKKCWIKLWLISFAYWNFVKLYYAIIY